MDEEGAKMQKEMTQFCKAAIYAIFESISYIVISLSSFSFAIDDLSSAFLMKYLLCDLYAKYRC